MFLEKKKGKHQPPPRGKIKLYSFLLEEMPKKHETWIALVGRVLQFEGTIWSIIGHCPETSPFPLYLSTISFRPLPHIEIFWQTVVRYSPRDLKVKVKIFHKHIFLHLQSALSKKNSWLCDCRFCNAMLECRPNIRIIFLNRFVRYSPKYFLKVYIFPKRVCPVQIFPKRIFWQVESALPKK